jgi:hypothetical protein
MQIVLRGKYTLKTHNRLKHFIPRGDIFKHTLKDCPCQPEIVMSEFGVAHCAVHLPFDQRDVLAHVQDWDGTFEEAVDMAKIYQKDMRDYFESGRLTEIDYLALRLDMEAAFNHRYNTN